MYCQLGQRGAAAQVQLQTFTIDRDDLKYAGRHICSIDSDAPALFLNLTKAPKPKRLHNVSLSCLITWDATYPIVGGTIYIAALLSVLLFGSETCWCDLVVTASDFAVFRLYTFPDFVPSMNTNTVYCLKYFFALF